jgi:hypothetical protein
MAFRYFLSTRQGDNIAIALSCDDCPAGLRALYGAMRHQSPAIYALFNHPDFYTTKRPAPLAAYSILARKAAEIAGEYWQAKGCAA